MTWVTSYWPFVKEINKKKPGWKQCLIKWADETHKKVSEDGERTIMKQWKLINRNE